MSTLDDLYSRGCGDVQDGALTPAHAVAAIRTADRLAATLHRSIEGGARPAFLASWREFYNSWLTYRTLQAERLARTEPARVVETDVPRFVRRCYEWRDAFATEGGRIGVGQAAPAPEGDFPWRPVLVLGGLALAGLAWRWWAAARQKARDEEAARQLEARQVMPAMMPMPMMPMPMMYPYSAPPAPR